MNHATLIFLGLLASFLCSWTGMVLAPQVQIGRQQPDFQLQPLNHAIVEGDVGEIYPQARAGLYNQGREIYQREGCYYCHSQQVAAHPADARWTKLNRFSVHRDYLFDQPALFGVQRIGPDLANVGLRQPDENWHLVHLLAPNAFMDGKAGDKSSMPPYLHLFEFRKIMPQGGSTMALKLPESVVLPKEYRTGYEVVPTSEARALVAYLQGLRQDVNIFEAPMYAPGARTNAVKPTATATNGPAN